jgi:N-methyl-L-proline demethylase
MPYPDKVSFRKRISELGIRSIVDARLYRVTRHGNRLLAAFRHELTGAEVSVETAQVVVEHGTLPVVEVYEGLRSFSANDGVTDVRWLAGYATDTERTSGCFDLHRIGDAVASRDVYSSIHDAYRLCSRAVWG